MTIIKSLALNPPVLADIPLIKGESEAGGSKLQKYRYTRKDDKGIVLKKLKEFFIKQSDIQLAYQFGSSLSADQHEESDIDIAILFIKKPHYQRVLQVSDKLTDIFNHEIDLGVLNEASPIFCMQVISKGLNIFCRDVKIKSYFVIRTVNEYDDLKYYRDFQKKNILKGRIFA